MKKVGLGILLALVAMSQFGCGWIFNSWQGLNLAALDIYTVLDILNVSAQLN